MIANRPERSRSRWQVTAGEVEVCEDGSVAYANSEMTLRRPVPDRPGETRRPGHRCGRTRPYPPRCDPGEVRDGA